MATRTALATRTGRGPASDPALEDALERISDLAARLWAVRQAHRPAVTGWLRRGCRCAGCGQPVPCPTLRATR